MSNNLFNKSSGFTLIEMLMVILIIGATTKIIAVSFEDLAFTSRYEQTVSRLDTIQQAIIGDSKRSINGQPDISGFVSDMGRLPANIRELIEQGVQNDYTGRCSNTAITTNKEDCFADGSAWLISGWRKHVNISDDPGSTHAYTDGWGNESANNYGWIHCLWDNADDIANAGTANNLTDDLNNAGLGDDCSNSQPYPNLTIYSLGKNATENIDVNGVTGCDGTNYDGDCYTTILEEDYTVDITSGISATFIKPLSSSVPISSFCSNPSFITKSTCITVNTEVTPNAPYGEWYGGCEKNGYINKSSCEDASLGNSTWHLCSDLSSSSKSACEAVPAIWFGEGYGCNNNASEDKASCETAVAGTADDEWRSCSDNGTIELVENCTNQNWYGNEMPVNNLPTLINPYQGKSICMKVFYRNKADQTIISTDSSAKNITENGSYQTINFSFSGVTQIPTGINAIGIYEHDGSICTQNLYPNDRDQPATIQFVPHSNLPIINW